MNRARRRPQLRNAGMNVSSSGLNPGPKSEHKVDADSEYGEPANNQLTVHSSKRPRINDLGTQECLPKATIMDLPPEIFAEVCKYLRPTDLVSLARCEPFRGCLKGDFFQSVWQGMVESVNGLPPCPSGLSERQYLTVLFSDVCVACGNTKEAQTDVILLVRLCDNCEEGWLTLLRLVPADIREFLHKSNVFGKGCRGRLPEARVLRSDVQNVLETLNKAGWSEGNHALVELEERMRKVVSDRRVQANKIIHALELYGYEAEWDRKETQTKRRLEIERRCIDELEMEKEDLQFSWNSPGRKRYSQLLDRPWLLYNYEWKEIRPKLKRLLVANRRARLAGKEGDLCRSQPSYKEVLERLGQSLTLEVDPGVDDLYDLEGIELLV